MSTAPLEQALKIAIHFVTPSPDDFPPAALLDGGLERVGLSEGNINQITKELT